MIKLSHETPLQLLEQSRDWNDYDYALVHHFEQYPDYFNFYKQSIEQGRMVILDNSIFELGNAFDSDEFATWVDKLQPTEYIVPDVLEDTEATIESFENWKTNYSDLPGIKIGVVQGKTYKEICKCYNYMRRNADKIAISFDYSFYLKIGLGDNKWQQYADGRRRLIHMLYEDSVWRDNMPHHLLGASVASEFSKYSGIWEDFNIVSLDTSNPIQQGLLNRKYNKNGLPDKDKTMVTDTFTNVYSDELVAIAKNNVKIFKDICTHIAY